MTESSPSQSARSRRDQTTAVWSDQAITAATPARQGCVSARAVLAALLTVALWTLDAGPALARTVLNEAPCEAGGIQTADPQDIAVDALGGRHYVADTGNGRVYVKAFGGSCSHTIQGTHAGELTLQEPWGVTLDMDERIYVSDRQSNSIWKYQAIDGFPTGGAPELVYAISDLGLDDPHGLGADGLDRVYIADTGNGRVVRMSSNGVLIDVLGKPDNGEGNSAGELLEPVDVAVCSASSTSDHAGTVYVVDRARGNVQAFRSDGGFAFSFGTKGSGLGEFKSPSGVDVDGQCNVYIADTGNQRSQMFDAAGNFLEVVKGPFDDPVTGIASNDIAGSPLGGVFVTSSARDSVTRYEWIDYDQTGDGDIDSDGDGLPELWELEGIDIDGDGTTDYQLPNADPLRKNLYIEADFTGGLAPMPVAGVPGANDHLDLVVDAFRKAPVTNPDGSTGIDLVIDRDDQIDHNGEGIAFNTDLDDPDVGFLFSTLKRENFGSPGERAQPDAADLLAGKSLVYRYVLFVKSICGEATLEPEPTCTGTAPLGGYAEPLGDDFVIAIKSQAPARQTTLFMHELGHTLGLRHGGGDDVNCKPNYLSVMNYTFTNGVPNPSAPLGYRFDYSRVALRNLNESHLNEAAGIGAAPVGPGGALTDFTLWSADGVTMLSERADNAIDWDADGQLEAGVAFNVNKVPTDGCEAGGGGPVLRGHDDWSHLVYAVRTSHDFLQPRRRTSPRTPLGDV